MEVVAKSEQYGTVISSNITPTSFIQFAAENSDFYEETLDGKIPLMQPQWSFTSVNPSVQNPHQLWLLTIHREEEPFKRKVTFMIFKSSLHTGESQQLRRLRESIRMNGLKRKVKYSLWQKHGRCLETVTSQPIRTKPTDVCGHPPYPSCSKLECIQFHVVSMHPTANEIWLLPHDRQLIYPIQYGVRCYEARTKYQLKYWTSRFCHHF